jgi:catechol 2,3-dioxygenase-like lactoylglutathione lyase family enzyme
VAQRIRAALPRYREFDDSAILSKPFALADAQELIARELGFGTWEGLRAGDGSTETSPEQVNGHEPRLLGAFPQLFVADVEVSCRFFVRTLGFTLRFKYGQPAFYALIQRDGARLNLRFVHSPVILRDSGAGKQAEIDLLAASIPVENIKSLYLEYKTTGVPMHQVLKKQPWGLRDFIIRDPDGNLVHFSE